MKQLIGLIQKLLPRSVFLFLYGLHAGWKSCRLLLFQYGFWKSAFRWSSVNRRNEPIPWLTYPAIEYLDSLDLRAKRIFEYGSGNSTLYWVAKGATVTAAEDDDQWRDRVAGKLAGKATLLFAREADAYANLITSETGGFDIVIIDGSHRLACARAAIPRLNPGGFIIVDDSDDYTDVTRALREASLIEIDFAGFNPINAYTKTTSLFLHKDFKPVFLAGSAPPHSLGHHASEGY